VEIAQEISLNDEYFDTIDDVFAFITEKFNVIKENSYSMYENVKIEDFWFSSYDGSQITLNFKLKRDETKEEELINKNRKNREKDYAWQSLQQWITTYPEFKERILNESK
jgi:hypothetical protein